MSNSQSLSNSQARLIESADPWAVGLLDRIQFPFHPCILVSLWRILMPTCFIWAPPWRPQDAQIAPKNRPTGAQNASRQLLGENAPADLHNKSGNKKLGADSERSWAPFWMIWDGFFTLRACPPTQFIFSGKSRSVTKLSRRPYVGSIRCRSLWGDPGAGRGGKGNQGNPKGTQGDGPMGPFGVIPKLFRMESHFEWTLNCAGRGTLISRWG